MKYFSGSLAFLLFMYIGTLLLYRFRRKTFLRYMIGFLGIVIVSMSLIIFFNSKMNIRVSTFCVLSIKPGKIAAMDLNTKELVILGNRRNPFRLVSYDEVQEDIKYGCIYVIAHFRFPLPFLPDNIVYFEEFTLDDEESKIPDFRSI